MIGISDRIYVMREGWITGCLSRGEASEESVLSLAMSESGETEGGD